MKRLFERYRNNDYELIFETIKSGLKGANEIKEYIDSIGLTEICRMQNIAPMAVKLCITNDTPNESDRHNDTYSAIYNVNNYTELIGFIRKILITMTDKINELIENDKQFLRAQYVASAYRYTNYKNGTIKFHLTIFESKTPKYYNQLIKEVMRDYNIIIEFREFNTNFEL